MQNNTYKRADIARHATTTAAMRRGRTIIRDNRPDIGKKSLSLHYISNKHKRTQDNDNK